MLLLLLRLFQASETAFEKYLWCGNFFVCNLQKADSAFLAPRRLGPLFLCHVETYISIRQMRTAILARPSTY